MARRLLDEEGAAASGCAGVSLAFCGIVDDERGSVLATLDDKFEDAIACDLPAWSERAFGIPLRIENGLHGHSSQARRQPMRSPLTTTQSRPHLSSSA